MNITQSTDWLEIKKKFNCVVELFNWDSFIGSLDFNYNYNSICHSFIYFNCIRGINKIEIVYSPTKSLYKHSDDYGVLIYIEVTFYSEMLMFTSVAMICQNMYTWFGVSYRNLVKTPEDFEIKIISDTANVPKIWHENRTYVDRVRSRKRHYS